MAIENNEFTIVILLDLSEAEITSMYDCPCKKKKKMCDDTCDHKCDFLLEV